MTQPNPKKLLEKPPNQRKSDQSTKVKNTKPLRHQTKAIQAGVKHFQNNTRGKLISPCGTGKSLTGYWLSQKLGQKTIITAHNIGLLSQSLTTWLKETHASKKNIQICCICSDETVGDTELTDITTINKIPCFTNIKEIASWLQKNKNSPLAIFSTYQSGANLAQAARETKTTFDVGIIDEAHKTAGHRQKPFGVFLHNENIRIKNRIFMTATERRYQGGKNDVISMEDPKIYGKTFYQLSYRQALQENPKILCDYQILIIQVSKKEIQEMITSEEPVLPKGKHWKTTVSARSIAAVIALRRAMKQYPITHTISFHKTIASAQIFQHHQASFTKHYRSWGKIQATHINGAMSSRERIQILEAFKSEKTGIITNARCLIEGIDVPQVNAILFAEGKYSIIDTIQATGRAMRPFPGKKKSYVIIPLIINEDNTDKGLTEVANILRSLVTTDDRVIQYFQLPGENENKDDLIQFELKTPEKGTSIDIKEFTRNIKIQCWKKVSYRLAWRPFEEARNFARSLNLTSLDEWKKLWKENKLPPDLPSNPNTTYGPQKGWMGWTDWLQGKKIYLPFNEAKKKIKEMGITPTQWRQLKKENKLPEGFPPSPSTYYKTQWNSWYDWFGNKPPHRDFLPFEEAKNFVHSLKLKTSSQWDIWAKKGLPGKPPRPKNIPNSPEWIYKNQWTNIHDWLGITKKEFLPFKEARKVAHELAKQIPLSSYNQWIKFPKEELYKKGLPAQPEYYYKKEWISRQDWLGLPIITKWKFEKARAYARSLKLKNTKEWLNHCKRKNQNQPNKPPEVPTYPNEAYEGQYQGMKDWLNIPKKSPKIKPSPKKLPRKSKNKIKRWNFQTAREFIRKLKLSPSSITWEAYCRGDFSELPPRPNGVPTNPKTIYKPEWKGWGDWMGKPTPTLAADLAQDTKWNETHYASYGSGRGLIQWTHIQTSRAKGKVTLTGIGPDGFQKKATAPSNTPMRLIPLETKFRKSTKNSQKHSHKKKTLVKLGILTNSGEITKEYQDILNIHNGRHRNNRKILHGI